MLFHMIKTYANFFNKAKSFLYVLYLIKREYDYAIMETE